MKTQLILADTSGPGFYRQICPGTTLQKLGEDISFDFQWQTSKPRYNKLGKVIGVRKTDFDVIVLQSPQRRHIVECIPFVQAHGTAVVVELDDDFWSVNKEQIGYKNFAAMAHPDEANFEVLAKACELADLVTVSTKTLAKKIPSDKVVVLPNYVPEYFMDIELSDDDDRRVQDDRLKVGWTGDPELHVGDLEVTKGGVSQAVREAGAMFVDIGGRGITGPMLGFTEDEGVHFPWLSMNDYPYAVKNFDIGIVPLCQSEFNMSKSELKSLEYMALGIPFLASPTAAYKELCEKHGVGKLVDDYDWHGELYSLMTEPAWRESMIAKGLTYARKNTYEKHAHKWREAWQQAIQNRESVNSPYRAS